MKSLPVLGSLFCSAGALRFLFIPRVAGVFPVRAVETLNMLSFGQLFAVSRNRTLSQELRTVNLALIS